MSKFKVGNIMVYQGPEIWRLCPGDRVRLLDNRATGLWQAVNLDKTHYCTIIEAELRPLTKLEQALK